MAKGFNIQIGGDTTKLQMALDKLTQESKKTTRELYQIENVLKNTDYKNISMLAQKQDVLNMKYEESVQKLKILKQAKEEAESTGNLDKNTTEYRALQREIVKTEENLKSLSKEQDGLLKKSSLISQWSDNFTKAGEKINSLGKKLRGISYGALGGLVGTSKVAIDFEDDFAGVRKTVNATEKQFQQLQETIIRMSKEMPSSTKEIAEVMEMAGQLGISADQLEEFSKTIIDLSNSTNILGAEGASNLAKFANVMGMSKSEFRKFGSAIVDLGNNTATTEKDILNMSMRIAGAGKQAGLTESEVLGISAALSSVGIEAEMGGSAFSKFISKMQVAVETGNDDLSNFSEISGMTAKEFKQTWEKDPVKAIDAFIKGLAGMEGGADSAIVKLDEMGIKEVRLRDTLLRLTGASNILTDSVNMSNNAWKANTALTNEANERYKTRASQTKITKNNIMESAKVIGDKLLPIVDKLLNKTNIFVNKISELDDGTLELIVVLGLFTAALSPVMRGMGNIVSGMGKLLETGPKILSGGKQMLTLLGNPTILALAAVVAGITAISVAIAKTHNEQKKLQEANSNKFWNGMAEGISETTQRMNEAQSSFDEFKNSIANKEEFQQIENGFAEVNEKITEIIRRAVNERRDLNNQEIQELQELYAKKEELYNKELDLLNNTSKNIFNAQLAQLHTWKGTEDEAKLHVANMIQTQVDYAEQAKALEEKRHQEELIRLSEEYGEKATIDNEEYINKVATLEKRHQEELEKIDQQTNERLLKISEENNKKNSLNEDFSKSLKEYKDKMISTEAEYNEKMSKIKGEEESGWARAFGSLTSNLNSEQILRSNHNKEVDKLNKEFLSDMNESNAKELGEWIGRLAQTELYGGKISDENKETLDVILKNWDSLPQDTKDVMKDAMQGMLVGMEKQTPTLFQKATNIANGVLNRLRKAFDIHSPSKEMMKISQYLIEGSIEGLDLNKKKLFKSVDNMSEDLLEKFKQLYSNDLNYDFQPSMIDKTQTIITTPNVVFNVQEMDEYNLNKAFNYMNKRFGGTY